MRVIVLVAVCNLLSYTILGQKAYNAHRVSQAIAIDGDLNEQLWSEADIATDFTTSRPIFGNISVHKSIVKIVYDDEAIYVGGEMHDPRPDSVNFNLSQRDDYGNSDWFRINIDPYGNAITAYSFGITSVGVEVDGIEGTDGGPGFGDIDKTWNAVWRSAAKKTEYGWSFEMKIPYSAIRFPNKEVQEWKINLHRQVRRKRETSSWAPIDPLVYGKITQSGNLVGISDIKPPLRLSFTPYVTGYMEKLVDATGWASRVTGGMDLKYGINDAFTLDMTLIPDFGQTTSDNQVLNLGPFEVRYNENRPFFLEGMDLFSLGGLFYSRRIGGLPSNYYDLEVNDSLGEKLISNPDTSPLYNATKISGRTKKGLGIGFFNAVEGKTEATIVDSLGNQRFVETSPVTNYNVFVLAQNLRNNGVLALINTNVLRAGSSRDANVTGVGGEVFSPDGMYSIGGEVKVSSIYEDESFSYGHAASMTVSKVSGTWNYGFYYGEESDTYDPNDLGFLYNNNERVYGGVLSWNSYVPSKHFYSRKIEFELTHEELYKPRVFASNEISIEYSGLHKRQVYTELSSSLNIFGSIDHFSSRKFGREVRFNPSASARWFFTSDYSKVVALDGSFSWNEFFGVNQRNLRVWFGPRFRISNRMNLRMESSYAEDIADYGWVENSDPAYEGDIILGYRNRTTVVNSVNSEFIFTKRMGIDLRLRHYWSQVDYSRFVRLMDDGVMVESDYNPIDATTGESIHNTSYNAFTLDVNFRWIFIPGSELRVVYKNNLFHSTSELDKSYFATFENLFENPQINSVSLKLLVYIDALYFRKRAK